MKNIERGSCIQSEQRKKFFDGLVLVAVTRAKVEHGEKFSAVRKSLCNNFRDYPFSCHYCHFTKQPIAFLQTKLKGGSGCSFSFFPCLNISHSFPPKFQRNEYVNMHVIASKIKQRCARQQRSGCMALSLANVIRLYYYLKKVLLFHSTAH